MKKFIALSLSDVVFIMLINVKMPTIVVNFNIYEQDKFDAQLSWAQKSFITSGPGPGEMLSWEIVLALSAIFFSHPSRTF